MDQTQGEGGAYSKGTCLGCDHPLAVRWLGFVCNVQLGLWSKQTGCTGSKSLYQLLVRVHLGILAVGPSGEPAPDAGKVPYHSMILASCCRRQRLIEGCCVDTMVDRCTERSQFVDVCSCIRVDAAHSLCRFMAGCHETTGIEWAQSAC